ncbi:MAG: hypothetical protein PVJ84_10565, partial [Desulfobacteraceae bacterium]
VIYPSILNGCPQDVPVCRRLVGLCRPAGGFSLGRLPNGGVLARQQPLLRSERLRSPVIGPTGKVRHHRNGSVWTVTTSPFGG